VDRHEREQVVVRTLSADDTCGFAAAGWPIDASQIRIASRIHPAALVPTPSPKPGGHGEPSETEGWVVALREALEGTGVVGLVRHAGWPGLLDVDVHRIPARGDVPEHDHLDLRYLFTAPPDATLRRCAEETRD
jgi:hypothetical protein